MLTGIRQEVPKTDPERASNQELKDMNAHCTQNQVRSKNILEQSESVTISKSRQKCQTPGRVSSGR